MTDPLMFKSVGMRGIYQLGNVLTCARAASIYASSISRRVLEATRSCLEASTSKHFLSSPMFPIDMTFQPPRVQRFVTLLPIKMHSVLENWIESIEIQCSLMLSLDPFSF